MTTPDIIAALGLRPVTAVQPREVTGAIVADLLSDVLANGAPGYLWITIQTHRNVAAVASAQSLAAIVITNERQPGEDLLALAEAEGVTVLCSDLTSYEVAGRLYEAGVR